MTTVSPTIDVAARHQALQDKVAEAAERLNVPGVAVGIDAHGEQDIVCSGTTSIENPLDVDAGTLFQVGSTTKTYTATALMILAERGLVDLDATVRTYLPELRLKDEAAAHTVTVLQLLNHTAGWRGDVREDANDGDDALERFVATMAGVDQVTAPGAAPSYNNAAVNVAGRILEKLTGTTYESAIAELLLQPLGMDRSFFFAGEVMSRRFVCGHRRKEDRNEVARPWALPRASHPCGGLVSTVADQLRYARFHLGDGRAPNGEQLISEATLRRMREPTVSLGGGALGDWVGVSWLMRDVEGVRIVGHGGSTNGQQSSLDLVPERDLAFTILTNADAGILLIREISDWILEEYLGVAEPEVDPLALTTSELAVFAGCYDAGHALVDVTVEADRLVLSVRYTEEGLRMLREILGGETPPEQPPIPVRILPRDRFVVVDGDAKGMKGNILRRDDGAIQALNVGGRLAFRRS